MPQLGGAPECPKCSKKVYHAEGVIGAGRSWHKICFRCCGSSCNRMLDSNSVREHEGKVYCAACYGKQYGPKGYGFGQGAGTLSTDSGRDSYGQTVWGSSAPASDLPQ